MKSVKIFLFSLTILFIASKYATISQIIPVFPQPIVVPTPIPTTPQPGITYISVVTDTVTVSSTFAQPSVSPVPPVSSGPPVLPVSSGPPVPPNTPTYAPLTNTVPSTTVTVVVKTPGADSANPTGLPDSSNDNSGNSLNVKGLWGIGISIAIVFLNVVFA